jgi:hypothetical protein
MEKRNQQDVDDIKRSLRRIDNELVVIIILLVVFIGAFALGMLAIPRLL